MGEGKIRRVLWSSSSLLLSQSIFYLPVLRLPCVLCCAALVLSLCVALTLGCACAFSWLLLCLFLPALVPFLACPCAFSCLPLCLSCLPLCLFLSIFLPALYFLLTTNKTISIHICTNHTVQNVYMYFGTKLSFKIA